MVWVEEVDAVQNVDHEGGFDQPLLQQDSFGHEKEWRGNIERDEGVATIASVVARRLLDVFSRVVEESREL